MPILWFMVLLNNLSPIINNLYSIDEDWGKTICIGEILDTIEVISTPNILKGYFNNYSSCTVWNNGFGAIYIGAYDADIYSGLKKDVEVHLFDWEGTPIAKILFNRRIGSFDIDFDNNVLYAIDSNEDMVVKYDMQDFIANLTVADY